jgi:glyoxylase-like metal-dependent hydrolase (beta-lactamase superfamily II)
MRHSLEVGSLGGTTRLGIVLLTSFPAGPLHANCYVVALGPGTDCVVIDPGMEAIRGVRQVVEEHNLTPQAVLITHGHFDHVWCAQDVAAEYGSPVWIHPSDRHLLSDPMAAISGESAALLRQHLEGIDGPDFAEPAGVRDAVEGRPIEVGGLSFTVNHAPGHTPGTVTYRFDWPEDAAAGQEGVGQVMFSGDFLFAGSIGRTDLTGGSMEQMNASLERNVLAMPDDIVVLPGHGPQTSIGAERVSNPFLAQVRAGGLA